MNKKTIIEDRRVGLETLRATRLNVIPENTVCYQFEWRSDLGKQELIAKPGSDANAIVKQLLVKGLRCSGRLAKVKIEKLLNVADGEQELHFLSSFSGWSEVAPIFLNPGVKRKTNYGNLQHCCNDIGVLGRCGRGSNDADNWRSEMSAIVSTSPILILALAASATSQLLKFAKLSERPFFLFHGESRTGKTQLLRAAQGMFASSESSDILSGDTTSAAFQEHLSARRDYVFCVDEVNKFHDDAVGLERALNLAILGTRGTGTRRSNSVHDRLPDSFSRSVILATSEDSVSEIARSNGRKLQKGLQHRVMELGIAHQADGGIFRASSEGQSQVLSAKLEDCISKYQGACIARWIQYLEENFENLSEMLEKHVSIFMKRPSAGDALTPTVKKRFAFVYAAGCLFLKSGLAPWTHNQLKKSIWSLFKDCDDGRRFSAPIVRTSRAVLNATTNKEVDGDGVRICKVKTVKSREGQEMHKEIILRTDGFSLLGISDADVVEFREYLRANSGLRPRSDSQSGGERYTINHRFSGMQKNSIAIRLDVLRNSAAQF